MSPKRITYRGTLFFYVIEGFFLFKNEEGTPFNIGVLYHAKNGLIIEAVINRFFKREKIKNIEYS